MINYTLEEKLRYKIALTDCEMDKVLDDLNAIEQPVTYIAELEEKLHFAAEIINAIEKGLDGANSVEQAREAFDSVIKKSGMVR